MADLLDRLMIAERRIRPSSYYLLLLILVAFSIGVLSADYLLKPQSTAEYDSVKQLEKLSSQLKVQSRTLAAKELELVLAQEANAKMRTMFEEQVLAQQQLSSELNFYRNIMAPENIADGVSIHGLELLPTGIDNRYRCKLILTQLQKRKQAIKGRAELRFVGIQQGETVSLKLSELIEDHDLLKFSFRYFQVIEAEFSLPDSFKLSHVISQVKVPRSRWTKGSDAELEFTLAEILAVD